MPQSKLTAAERRWLNKLQQLLDECPTDRMQAYTIGDPILTIFDGSRMQEINDIITASGFRRDFCSAAEEAKANLLTLRFPFQVHSTAG